MRSSERSSERVGSTSAVASGAAVGSSPTAPPALDVRGVSKVFTRGKRTVEALKETDLQVAEGQFLTVLGPSGCGKSTLLHVIGGFEQATEGEVLLNGQPVRKPGRDRGMVFQQATLFPWWTIERNVAWPFEVGGTGKKQARERSQELLALVGLEGFANAYPGELSGGMNQRAALARTLALEPQVLLMDEPFGALDAQTRELMQEELNRIWQTAGITVVFITHDIYEAVFLGDRVVVMSARPGRVIEDIPIELERPRDSEVKKSQRMVDYHSHLWDLLRTQAERAERNR